LGKREVRVGERDTSPHKKLQKESILPGEGEEKSVKGDKRSLGDTYLGVKKGRKLWGGALV